MASVLTGFEPARQMPIDFKSISLTTRTQHLYEQSGVRTHEDLRPPELESGALDHSAMCAQITPIGFEPTTFLTHKNALPN